MQSPLQVATVTNRKDLKQERQEQNPAFNRTSQGLPVMPGPRNRLPWIWPAQSRGTKSSDKQHLKSLILNHSGYSTEFRVRHLDSNHTTITYQMCDPEHSFYFFI